MTTRLAPLTSQTGVTIIRSPGKFRPEPIVYGSVKQSGSITGQICLIVGRALRLGMLAVSGLPRPFSCLLLRALAAAPIAAAVGCALAVLLAQLSGLTSLDWAAALAIKAFYGVALFAIVTPISVRAVLMGVRGLSADLD